MSRPPARVLPRPPRGIPATPPYAHFQPSAAPAHPPHFKKLFQGPPPALVTAASGLHLFALERLPPVATSTVLERTPRVRRSRHQPFRHALTPPGLDEIFGGAMYAPLDLSQIRTTKKNWTESRRLCMQPEHPFSSSAQLPAMPTASPNLLCQAAGVERPQMKTWTASMSTPRFGLKRGAVAEDRN